MTMSFWKKIQSIDRRILYVLLFIAIILVAVVPFPQLITPTALTKTFSDSIAALKTGDVAVISVDHTPATLAELNGGTTVAIAQLKSKGAKIIFWSIAFPEGAPIYETRLQPLMKDQKYGVDYVNFGYITGKESAAEVLGKNIRSILKTDAYGKPIDSLPMMSNVNGAKDVSLLITVDDGSATIMWVQQWVVPYKTKLDSIVSAGIVPMLLPYVRSNQVTGMLQGLPGVAEYETLQNMPGIGVLQMRAITTTSLLLLIAIFVGIAGYLGERFLGEKVRKHD
jgi:hypothetical protein